MLSKTHRLLSNLPLREAFFAPPPPTEKSCPASCFMISCGVEQVEDKPSYCFDNRTRGNFCLLQYTIEGEGTFDDLLTDQTIPLPAGTAFLITAPSPTRYRIPHGGHWKQAYALFSGAAAFHHCQQTQAACGMIFELGSNAPTSETVLQRLYEINASTNADKISSRDFFSASDLTYQLLMHLRRYAENHQSPVNQPASKSITPALKLIERRYSDSGLGVDELAASCNYSRYHFTRLFHSATGASPQALLIKTRLQHALRLLTNSELPAKQIAIQCGINDYSYFCLLFKRNYGLTPGSIRRNTNQVR